VSRATNSAATARRRADDKDAADVESFADHEIITPRHNLTRHAKRVRTGVDLDMDAIARAEAAVADIAHQFADWMTDECERLAEARSDWKQQTDPLTRNVLYRAAHDIRGQAETLGHPQAGLAADSLCRLLDMSDLVPVPLVDQHVDAIRAIVREASRPDASLVAQTLVAALMQSVADHLAEPGQRLERIDSPSLQMSGGH
jgi:chemotaxis protein histidine kinase CheA